MIFAEWMDIFAQITVAVILTLRTYAIYNRSLKILALVGSLGTVIPAIGFWISGTLTAGSHTAQSDSPIPFRSMLLSLFTLIFDTVVICLTIWKSLQERGARRNRRQSVLDLILFNGSIYYCALSSTHIFNILLYWLAPRGLCGIGIPPSRSISVVLVCRFMLNLREQFRGSPGIHSIPRPGQWELSSLVFVSPEMQSITTTSSDSDERFFRLPSLGFEGSFQFSFLTGDESGVECATV